MPSSDKNRALSSPAKELGPVGSDFAESVLTELRGSGLAQEIERSKRLDALENWEEEVHGPRYREEPSKEYIDQVKNKIYRGGFDDLTGMRETLDVAGSEYHQERQFAEPSRQRLSSSLDEILTTAHLANHLAVARGERATGSEISSKNNRLLGSYVSYVQHVLSRDAHDRFWQAEHTYNVGSLCTTFEEVAGCLKAVAKSHTKSAEKASRAEMPSTATTTPGSSPPRPVESAGNRNRDIIKRVFGRTLGREKAPSH